MHVEKRLLQFIVVIACIIPISTGFCGAVFGVDMLGGGNINLDSHFRYLSGLLLGIGFGFLSAVPRVEKHKQRVQLLTFIVVTGGLGRLLGVLVSGVPNTSMLAALGMELAVTPLLCLWQHRIARLFSQLPKNGAA